LLAITGNMCLNNLKVGLSLAQLKSDYADMSTALESRRKDRKSKLNAIETSLIKAIDQEA